MITKARIHDWHRRAEAISEMTGNLLNEIVNEQNNIYHNDKPWFAWYNRTLSKGLVLRSAMRDVRTFIKKIGDTYDE